VLRIAGALVLVAAGLVPLVTSNTYYLFVAILIGISIVVTTGLNVLAGASGQVSLGQAGFYALGAYAGAILATRAGVSFWLALPLAAVVGIVVGAVLGLAALRVSGPYLAMVTIAFGIIVEHGLIEWDALTAGFGGIADIPRPALGGLALTLPRYYYVVGLAVLASLAVARNLGRSPWGRALVAVRDSEIAAESLGLNPYLVRTVAFTLGAAFAAVGGCLYAFLAGFVSPDSFTLQTSILFLLIVLFGGLGTLAGPLVGATVLVLLPELLRGFLDYRLILYGGLLPSYGPLARKRIEREALAGALRDAVSEIESNGCVVKDLEKGLVDFPSIVNDEQVFLCWKLGEPGIRFWHRMDEGFTGRKPLGSSDAGDPEDKKPN